MAVLSQISRRALIAGLAAAVPASAVAETRPVRAIAFDAFPIFDPRPIAGLARSRFGDRGEQLASAWSTQLFGYAWLTTAGGRYLDFATLADAALAVTAESLGLALTSADRALMVGAYEQMGVWPDVVPILTRLKAAGVRLVLLSNLGERALQANMLRNGLETLLEAPLSTDRVRQFKPAPAAYRMAIEALALPRASIGFAAFAGWDAAGATWFGYRTAWINRLSAPAEPALAQPSIVTTGLDGALALAGLGQIG